MSKLRRWHILVVGIAVPVIILVLGFFLKIRPLREEAARLRSQAEEARAYAEREEEFKQGVEDAKRQREIASRDWRWFRRNKMPYVARNPWWRSIREGHAWQPHDFWTPLGSSGGHVLFRGEHALAYDFYYELSEDLGPLLKEFIEASGCDVSDFSWGMPSEIASNLTSANIRSYALNVTLTITGEYEKVLNLIRHLHKFPRLIGITSLSISAVPGSAGRIVQATMPVTIYLLADVSPTELLGGGAAPTEAGAAAAGAPPEEEEEYIEEEEEYEEEEE